MAVLRPYDKLPMPNVAAVLLVGSEENHMQLLANAILKEPRTFDVKIHLTQSLPLPLERENLRPRFDMVVFLINLHSQYSFNTVLSSMKHLDAHFYLGKVCFLATKGKEGHIQHCSVDITAVKDVADKHLSMLIQTELNNDDDVMYTAQRLLNYLKICAGFVPGISSVYVGSYMKNL